jgi:hypothetical protein
MEIEGTTFGTITIDGKTYEHDVIIRLSGEVVKRKKKLSKKEWLDRRATNTSNGLMCDPEKSFALWRSTALLLRGRHRCAASLTHQTLDRFRTCANNRQRGWQSRMTHSRHRPD